MAIGAKLPTGVVDALRSVGATSEMIDAAAVAWGLEVEAQRVANRAANAARKRRSRAAKRLAGLSDVTDVSDVTHERCTQGQKNDLSAPLAVTQDRDDVRQDRERRLLLAAGINAPFSAYGDMAIDYSPISELLDRGCDLDLDLIPTVARLVPFLPRPLRSWDAPWLIRAILEARDRRLEKKGDLPSSPVKPPIPVQEPALDWDELVFGYARNMIEWNSARLGPRPGEFGCRAPAEVLSANGY